MEAIQNGSLDSDDDIFVLTKTAAFCDMRFLVSR